MRKSLTQTRGEKKDMLDKFVDSWKYSDWASHINHRKGHKNIKSSSVQTMGKLEV